MIRIAVIVHLDDTVYVHKLTRRRYKTEAKLKVDQYTTEEWGKKVRGNRTMLQYDFFHFISLTPI